MEMPLQHKCHPAYIRLYEVAQTLHDGTMRLIQQYLQPTEKSHPQNSFITYRNKNLFVLVLRFRYCWCREYAAKLHRNFADTGDTLQVILQ